MRRDWFVDEVLSHQLPHKLNLIESVGGQIVSVIPSDRAQYDRIVWFKEHLSIKQQGQSKPRE
jgi:hypothetical protein